MGEPIGTDDPPAPTPQEAESVRLLRRSEPRLSIALAGAGAVLAVTGAIVIGGDNGASGDSFNRWPGVAACSLVVAVGYAALALVKRGALAAAGTVAAAVGVLALLVFLTLDEGSAGISGDVVFGASSAVWLVTWALGPSRHRPFFLGAACVGVWLTVLDLSEGIFNAPLSFTTSIGPSGSVGPDGIPPFPSDTGPGIPFDSGPDPTTIGVISLVFGAAYLIAARGLDSRRRAGAGTPVTAAALVTLAVGIGFLAPDLEAMGTGLLLMLVGAIVCVHGAMGGRRFSTWVGAAAVAIGIIAILGDLVDEATPAGFSLVGAGAALVIVAYAVAAGWDEPDELESGPSTFTSGQAISAWPDQDHSGR